jgi:signal peptidase I
MNPNDPRQQPNSSPTQQRSDISTPTQAPPQPAAVVMPPEAPKETGGPSLFERITSHWLVSWILVPAALIFFLHYFVFSAYHVVGSSMTPTLQDANYLIIAKVDHTKAAITGKKYIPVHGEIVVFHYPKDPRLDFVKRIVGVPGDRVTIKDGQVRVYDASHPNGFSPDQNHETNGNYTMSDDTDDSPVDITVPDGNVFVMGDNRQPGGSSDSRSWGFLPSEDIVGNVVLRLFPFNEIKTF